MQYRQWFALQKLKKKLDFIEPSTQHPPLRRPTTLGESGLGPRCPGLTQPKTSAKQKEGSFKSGAFFFGAAKRDVQRFERAKALRSLLFCGSVGAVRAQATSYKHNSTSCLLLRWMRPQTAMCYAHRGGTPNESNSLSLKRLFSFRVCSKYP